MVILAGKIGFPLRKAQYRSTWSAMRQTALVRSLASKPKKEFLPAYQAAAVEEGWYDWWDSQGYFKASSADYSQQPKKGPFTMLTPPPNVTGSLHIGHALTLSVEDCLARWHRMSGYDVRWIPGTDHAGIGTQTVVERKLMRDRQQSRHDLGRKAFIDMVWAWRDQYGDRILHQMRRMGASVSWDDVFFTMDKPRSEAVQNAFMRLYKDGLIYRDTRLVNWCCALETVISDIEVDYKDIQGRTLLKVPGREKSIELGVLHHFSYPVVDPEQGGIQQLTVSTTRIETMLGDCAVAIHPDDTRYKSLHGKSVYHPLLKRKLPIIIDKQLVDMSFGTGAVKITPAHDPNDFACARRHNLPIVSIFDKLGKLNDHGGIPAWTGKDRFEIREMVVDQLQQLGCYQGRDNSHAMRVAICSRSGDVIEPLLQPQWYIHCKSLAEASRKQAEEGRIQFYPEYHTQDWYRWLDNIQDWCISRQLWWGHEIPAYQIQIQGAPGADKDLWVAATNEAKADEEAQVLLQEKGLPHDTQYRLIKDEDVLDTWFSSGLLPLSALGWTGGMNEPIPERYPLQVMETGHDILFFWVARMAMLANHFVGQAPFETVMLHPMVRDAQGRKMSKSLGNVIDPLHVIAGVSLASLKEGVRHSNLSSQEMETSIRNLENEFPDGIQPCGTDALRMALVATQQNRQINLDIATVVQTSYFCNKLWNLCKFGFGRLEGFEARSTVDLDAKQLSLVNRYILSRLADTVARCEKAFSSLRLFDAADAVRRFIVEDVCDVYVEFSKPVLAQNLGADPDATRQILHACLEGSLRIAHPFMPFITEELWQHMREKVACPTGDLVPSLVVAPYPTTEEWAPWYDPKVEADFRVVLSIIHASRSLRQSHQISVAQVLPVRIWCSDRAMLGRQGPLQVYLEEIKSFIKASSLTIAEEELAEEGWTGRAIGNQLKIMVPTHAIVKAQLEKATTRGTSLEAVMSAREARVQRQLVKARQDQEKLTGRMNKEGYSQSAPEKVQEKNRQKVASLEMEIERLESDLKLLAKVRQQ